VFFLVSLFLIMLQAGIDFAMIPSLVFISRKACAVHDCIVISRQVRAVHYLFC